MSNLYNENFIAAVLSKYSMEIKNKIKKYSLLIENVISLSSIKGIEYILSFLTFPYLVRVLGMSIYGNIIFLQSIIQYFILITDYGFNLTGPKEIAKHDSIYLRGIYFSKIMSSKIFLLFCLTPIFICLCFILEYYSYNSNLLVLMYISVIGNVIFPVWFFQGIQAMRYITIFSTISRLVSTLGIFVLVRSPEDYLWAGFLQSIPPFIAGVISWFILKKHYPEVFRLSTWKDIKQTLIDSWGIFISSLAINIYTASNTFILGIITNPTMVGYFNSAYKIINCIQQIMMPISQAIYPYIAKLAHNNSKEAITFLKKYIIYFGIGNLIISIFIFFLAPYMVQFLLGTNYYLVIYMLKILSILPFVISLSNVLGIQIMLPFGMEAYFNKIIVTAAFLSIGITIPISYSLSGIGTCISMVLIETFITICMIICVYRKNIF